MALPCFRVLWKNRLKLYYLKKNIRININVRIFTYYHIVLSTNMNIVLTNKLPCTTFYYS